MVGASHKTLLLAATLFGTLACGDATSPTTTQPAASSAASATQPAPASVAPVQTAVTFVNAPITAARGLHATLQVRTAPHTSCSIEVDYKSGPSRAAGWLQRLQTQLAT